MKLKRGKVDKRDTNLQMLTKFDYQNNQSHRNNQGYQACRATRATRATSATRATRDRDFVLLPTVYNI